MTHLVFASDDKFMRPLMVASGSAIYAMRGKSAAVTVHILDCGITEGKWTDYSSLMNRFAQENKVELKIERLMPDLSRLPNNNGPQATWVRLLIPELLPDVDTCIYSDCDMIFIEDPSEMLKTFDNAQTLLVGHRNAFDDLSADAQWFKAQGLPFNAELCLCAGLIVMNLAAFRKENLIAKCFAFIAQYPNVTTRDQATLNYVCYGRTKVFTDGWGIYPHECYAYKGRLKTIHFTSGWPWHNRVSLYNATLYSFNKKINKVWYDFEERILKLPRSHAIKQPLWLQILATLDALAYRLADALKVKIPNRGWWQEMIADYCKHTPAIDNARRELFGDAHK